MMRANRSSRTEPHNRFASIRQAVEVGLEQTRTVDSTYRYAILARRVISRTLGVGMPSAVWCAT